VLGAILLPTKWQDRYKNLSFSCLANIKKAEVKTPASLK
jgi:hypothetical protein